MLKKIKRNTGKTPVKGIILSKVAGLQHATLPNIDILDTYFSKIFPTFQENQFRVTPRNDCFCDSDNL